MFERMEHEDASASEKPSFRERMRVKIHRARKGIEVFDKAVSSSTFGRIFRLEGSGHVRLSVPNIET